MIVFVPSGASVNAASLRVTRLSLSAMSLTVTLPLFVTLTVYVTVSPTFTPLVGLALFSTVSAAAMSSVLTVSEAV